WQQNHGCCGSGIPDRAEAYVGSAQALALALACLRAIAHAVVGSAEPGAALDDGDGLSRLERVQPLRVGGSVTEVVARIVGAGRPFPDIADQVMHTEPVRGKAT